MKPSQLLIVACCVSLVGCTTLTRVGLDGLAPRASPSEDDTLRVSEGDMVTIELKGGRRFEGRLERIGPESIEVRHGGEQALEAVRKDQIVAVEVRKFSPIKTVLLVAGITLGLYAYAYSKALEKLLAVW